MVALDSAICISHINDMSNWSNLPSIVDRVTQSGVYTDDFVPTDIKLMCKLWSYNPFPLAYKYFVVFRVTKEKNILETTLELTRMLWFDD